ncbi:signal recognition particle-docking protein FtsY [Chlamydia suis]|uniref:signal recognition particle-docking protein FtsY n=1 Tax=Chlamydia suis TaxID=83559 RepID=UPI0009B0D6DA|nr:signal recognition particle-docking protein FtsY [Chlamydia suis]QYC72108.1 signal recognition particle-docking protein FtsY [Chlamydia suis]QYC73007.1 signal recognition particle-docking protein FtsY [Chlamydia suis]QYC73903.1 signal recognition particle-docking protein FtsY [Chlamydia suis]QYC79369.1 signal recognition particle-docking protein FtsY [Chlamydia suis]QYC85779.1 signal recognition particle-docking protein FtsY [Chlamydia suis]
MFKFFGNKLRSLFKKTLPSDLLEYAELLLYEGDFGHKLTESFCRELRKHKHPDEHTLKGLIRSFLSEIIAKLPQRELSSVRPHATLVLGTNGSGKTTTVAKLAHYYLSQNQTVLIVATDTFRSAGMDQMRCWANSLNCGFISGKPGGDPAAIAFDGISAAIARDYDQVIIDTSGRLHTHTNLLKELQKIVSVCNKAFTGAPHETLMTIDATLGSNTLSQVSMFHEAVPIDGLIFTKVEGSAKGGSLFRIADELKIPTRFVGYGETVSDFEPFSIDRFLDKLLES